jgi:hypothetical protein
LKVVGVFCVFSRRSPTAEVPVNNLFRNPQRKWITSIDYGLYNVFVVKQVLTVRMYGLNRLKTMTKLEIVRVEHPDVFMKYHCSVVV